MVPGGLEYVVESGISARLVEDHPRFGKGPAVRVLQSDAERKAIHIAATFTPRLTSRLCSSGALDTRLRGCWPAALGDTREAKCRSRKISVRFVQSLPSGWRPPGAVIAGPSSI